MPFSNISSSIISFLIESFSPCHNGLFHDTMIIPGACSSVEESKRRNEMKTKYTHNNVSLNMPIYFNQMRKEERYIEMYKNVLGVQTRHKGSTRRSTKRSNRIKVGINSSLIGKCIQMGRIKFHTIAPYQSLILW